MKIKILPRNYKEPYSVLGHWVDDFGRRFLTAYNDGLGIVLKWHKEDRFYRVDWQNFVKNFIRSMR